MLTISIVSPTETVDGPLNDMPEMTILGFSDASPPVVSVIAWVVAGAVSGAASVVAAAGVVSPAVVSELDPPQAAIRESNTTSVNSFFKGGSSDSILCQYAGPWPSGSRPGAGVP